MIPGRAHSKAAVCESPSVAATPQTNHSLDFAHSWCQAWPARSIGMQKHMRQQACLELGQQAQQLRSPASSVALLHTLQGALY